MGHALHLTYLSQDGFVSIPFIDLNKWRIFRNVLLTYIVIDDVTEECIAWCALHQGYQIIFISIDMYGWLLYAMETIVRREGTWEQGSVLSKSTLMCQPCFARQYLQAEMTRTRRLFAVSLFPFFNGISSCMDCSRDAGGKAGRKLGIARDATKKMRKSAATNQLKSN